MLQPTTIELSTFTHTLTRADNRIYNTKLKLKNTFKKKTMKNRHRDTDTQSAVLWTNEPKSAHKLLWRGRKGGKTNSNHNNAAPIKQQRTQHNLQLYNDNHRVQHAQTYNTRTLSHSLLQRAVMCSTCWWWSGESADTHLIDAPMLYSFNRGKNFTERETNNSQCRWDVSKFWREFNRHTSSLS